MELGKIGAVVDAHEKPVTRTIQDPTGEDYVDADGNACTVDILGSESKAVRRAKAELSRRALHDRSRSRKRRAAAGMEMLEQNRREMAAAAIAGWSGWTVGGEPVPATHENKMAFLSPKDADGEVLDFILLQVEEVMYDHAGFSQNS